MSDQAPHRDRRARLDEALGLILRASGQESFAPDANLDGRNWPELIVLAVREATEPTHGGGVEELTAAIAVVLGVPLDELLTIDQMIEVAAPAAYTPFDEAVRIEPGERDGPGPDYVPAPRADASTVASDYAFAHGRPRSSESFTGEIVGAGEPPAEGTRRWHILEGLKGWLLANPGCPVTSEEEAIDFADAIEGRLVAAAAEHPQVSPPIFTRDMLERAGAELREGRDVGLVVSESEGHLRIEEVNHVMPRDFDPTGRPVVTESMITRAIEKGVGGDLDGLGEKFISEFLRPAVRGVLEDILGIAP